MASIVCAISFDLKLSFCSRWQTDADNRKCVVSTTLYVQSESGCNFSLFLFLNDEWHSWIFVGCISFLGRTKKTIIKSITSCQSKSRKRNESKVNYIKKKKEVWQAESKTLRNAPESVEKNGSWGANVTTLMNLNI